MFVFIISNFFFHLFISFVIDECIVMEADYLINVSWLYDTEVLACNNCATICGYYHSNRSFAMRSVRVYTVEPVFTARHQSLAILTRAWLPNSMSSAILTERAVSIRGFHDNMVSDNARNRYNSASANEEENSREPSPDSN